MTKFENDLGTLLDKYIHDPEDVGYNGEQSLNGAPILTTNPKTLENFLRWLKER